MSFDGNADSAARITGALRLGLVPHGHGGRVDPLFLAGPPGDHSAGDLSYRTGRGKRCEDPLWEIRVDTCFEEVMPDAANGRKP